MQTETTKVQYPTLCHYHSPSSPPPRSDATPIDSKLPGCRQVYLYGSMVELRDADVAGIQNAGYGDLSVAESSQLWMLARPALLGFCAPSVVTASPSNRKGSC